MIRTELPANLEGITRALDLVEEYLTKRQKKRKAIHEAMMLTEESMVKLMEACSEEDQIIITIRNRLDNTIISLSAPGHVISLDNGVDDIDIHGKVTRESESLIRDILLRGFAEHLQYKHRGEYNFIDISLAIPQRSLAVRTMVAMVLAILIGLLLRFVIPEITYGHAERYLFYPIAEVFIRLLMLITGPTVFFSIIMNISSFMDTRSPSRMSIKMFLSYIGTSVLAVCIGFGLFQIFTPGIIGQLGTQSLDTLPENGNLMSGLVATVVGMVPSNIIEPFFTLNTAQLIFMAVFVGVGLAYVGEYSNRMTNAFVALNTLFSKITVFLLKFLPVGAFAATVAMILRVGMAALISLLQMLAVLVLAVLSMLVIYLIAVAVVARVNPFIMLKKYGPLMWETFLLGSSVSAVPKTMRFCTGKLGVSSDISCFSIPMGAILNMDGNCAYLSIAILFMMNLWGFQVGGSTLVVLGITIIILSVGAPITPGTGLLCMAVLMSQFGISPESLTILMGINCVLEMFLAMTNTMGDVALTVMLAKSEGKLDRDVYCAMPARKG